MFLIHRFSITTAADSPAYRFLCLCALRNQMTSQGVPPFHRGHNTTYTISFRYISVLIISERFSIRDAASALNSLRNRKVTSFLLSFSIFQTKPKIINQVLQKVVYKVCV